MEQDELRLIKEAQKNAMYGPLRGLQLKSYVSNIRNTLYTDRLREKKEKYNESIVKYVTCLALLQVCEYVTDGFVTLCRAKEQKAKLYEARLKALAGDEE